MYKNIFKYTRMSKYIRIYYSLETLIPATEFLMLLCVFYYYMKQSKFHNNILIKL